MPYRLTKTEKWADTWFCDLSIEEKLLWFYILDNCDCAGIWEINEKKACFDTGIDARGFQGAMKGLARGYEGACDGKRIFIKKFIKHQKNFPLNLKNKAHLGIHRVLEEYEKDFTHISPLLGATKPLARVTGIGIGIGKDIGKGKDKELF